MRHMFMTRPPKGLYWLHPARHLEISPTLALRHCGCPLSRYKIGIGVRASVYQAFIPPLYPIIFFADGVITRDEAKSMEDISNILITSCCQLFGVPRTLTIAAKHTRSQRQGGKYEWPPVSLVIMSPAY
ncbi:hypothetical protein BOTBODRAFT_373281 [Botryobasidium botryosum FD-172 SS1]|uniref:Uncharacterized protein n=1 Tax=Botryobasidium botryosum (strain FD-172 SS1) TaxID=930990 RepID=A0A067MC96_BOTB1|nr:hypothetical protein BOTBODRAFT_373281 [Botryobasidium botryosum FD-172 SS1]